MENPLSSPFEAEEDVAVVIEEATIDEGGEVSLVLILELRQSIQGNTKRLQRVLKSCQI